MITLRTASFSNEAAANAILWINRGLEFLWLLTLVTVPLVFVDRESFLSELELAYVDVPKTVLLRTLVGLLAVLWLIELALQRWVQIGHPSTRLRQPLQPEALLGSIIDWLRGDPARWVFLAVVLYLISTLLSTALSESFVVSMWGLVPGQDTYRAYTITCYVVLFGVMATHVKRKAQAQRMLWSIAVMGVLVGGYSWSQFYGHDLFNLREYPGGAQSGSTLGNAILAGAVLLMTITLSLVAATIALSDPVRSVRFWRNLVLWTPILIVQMTALIFASSRGPWGGTVVALVVLLGLTAIHPGWRYVGRLVLIVAVSGGLTAGVVLLPPPIPSAGPVETGGVFLGQSPVDSSPLAVSVTSRIASIGHEAASVGHEATSINRGVGGGGLAARIEIWKTSWRLMLRRTWFEFDSPSSRLLLRPFIGYGPDMFKYTYLLERLPRGPDQSVVSERFAHNLLFHKGVELGFLGLITTLGLFIAPVVAGGYKIFRRRPDESPFSGLVMVGLMAAVAGRFVEQMVGVAAVSDLTIFWTLLALFVALPACAGVSSRMLVPVQAHLQGHRPSRLTPTAGPRIFSVGTVLPAVVALCLIAGIGVLTWTKSINYLQAGFEAREGLDWIRGAEFKNAQVSLDRAIELAPDVSVYHTLRAAVYSGYRRQDNGPRDPGCAHLAAAAPYEGCLTRRAHISFREASEQRSFDWRPRLDLAESALTLALMERDPDMADEALRLYRDVAQMDPQTWWHWEELAAAHIQVGRPEAAFEPLEKTLSILGGIPRSAISRLLQGMAYLRMNEPAAALRSFNETIRLNPNLADAYNNRGSTYNLLGQYQRAIKDLDKAIKLNPDLAMAYNNRGNSYGTLDHLQRAIEDYNEAIRLDPQLALAYSNRALAYTYLGRDDDARMDVEQGTELGLDPAPILAKMEEVKANRSQPPQD